MRFWDASAVLPLLVAESRSGAMAALLREDPAVAAWWGTPAECVAALARLERDGQLSEDAWRAATARLAAAGRGWVEVPPTTRVREQATRLLRLHPLRGADALQLAAALVLADFAPATLPFVTLDRHLAGAARREGFEVVGA